MEIFSFRPTVPTRQSRLLGEPTRNQHIPNCPGRGPPVSKSGPSLPDHPMLAAFSLRSSSPPQTLSSSPPFPFTTTSPSTSPSTTTTYPPTQSIFHLSHHSFPAHAHSGDAWSDVPSPFPCPIMALELQPPDGRKRVKVYELRENDWFDRGTGFCTGHIAGVSLKGSPISSSSRQAHSPVAPAVSLARDSFPPGRA